MIFLLQVNGHTEALWPAELLDSTQESLFVMSLEEKLLCDKGVGVLLDLIFNSVKYQKYHEVP